ncbi:PqqD family protein [Streptomyces sp. PTM05]|uniref:PqqD family protein n=1 Tax=Streptantibioticus parmotrematis TaxID=2873249 RepID=A0ABS7QSC1_9ACTN|nr:PqqD family protein [Streptantibioticus parmotrematis]MBY8884717.1 PqqD family protein [Streptantibioticus parmotrematis]
MSTVHDDDVLVRRLDVTARLTCQVEHLSERAEGGVLLETLIGRYVLDSDGRTVWLLIDGRRTVGEVVTAVAEKLGLPVAEVREVVRTLCGRLLELGLVETPSSFEAEILTQSAVAG